MTLRCAVLDDYQGVALRMADWSVLDGQVDVTVYQKYLTSEDQVVDALRDQQIVVIMRERTPFPASLFARLPGLKLLITSGMRNNSIDLAAAAEAGVTVCGTRSTSEAPVELTWALLLGLARNIVAENNAFRADGPWQSTLGVGLAGKTLGLVGLGKIGTQVARIGQAFGMDVCAWSPNLTSERAAAADVRLAASKAELLSGSDFVSIHLVLSDRTRGLIDDLSPMRPSAFLINTSRAAIVDQQALVTALQQGLIAGAGLDVFEQEPLPHGHVLRTLPNVLATPHLGYVTEGNYRIYFPEAVEDIQAYLAGSPIRQL